MPFSAPFAAFGWRSAHLESVNGLGRGPGVKKSEKFSRSGFSSVRAAWCALNVRDAARRAKGASGGDIWNIWNAGPGLGNGWAGSGQTLGRGRVTAGRQVFDIHFWRVEKWRDLKGRHGA